MKEGWRALYGWICDHHRQQFGSARGVLPKISGWMYLSELQHRRTDVHKGGFSAHGGVLCPDAGGSHAHHGPGQSRGRAGIDGALSDRGKRHPAYRVFFGPERELCQLLCGGGRPVGEIPPAEDPGGGFSVCVPGPGALGLSCRETEGSRKVHGRSRPVAGEPPEKPGASVYRGRSGPSPQGRAGVESHRDRGRHAEHQAGAPCGR